LADGTEDAALTVECFTEACVKDTSVVTAIMKKPGEPSWDISEDGISADD
jgi:hypothetical protein